MLVLLTLKHIPTFPHTQTLLPTQRIYTGSRSQPYVEFDRSPVIYNVSEDKMPILLFVFRYVLNTYVPSKVYETHILY